MTKRLNSKHKVDRRLKANLWGRPKSPFNKRDYGPGQHGQGRKGKLSDYGTQLQAKQKLKAYYGNINERQGSVSLNIDLMILIFKIRLAIFNKIYKTTITATPIISVFWSNREARGDSIMRYI